MWQKELLISVQLWQVSWSARRFIFAGAGVGWGMGVGSSGEAVRLKIEGGGP